ncbi:DUF5977 domain-containing protein [Larkinella humicola]|uniref:DUF5977 domain-containing protein n=1 Tax=Larkinella humicola TaxID=2607654 RepID=A0A5N1J8L5_9BACT|nr:DUF5977 domain-containing protein [Larkinella humicola]KAA9346322.1 hypothetical protein F0P93_29075 [Larkinella humicola]
MDALATLTHYPVHLTGNPIVVNTEAADPITYPDRTGLRYGLTLMTPPYFLANTFEELDTLVASEIPPEVLATGSVYKGAYFDIARHLDSLLIRTPPTFRQPTIGICESLTTPYYVRRIRTHDDALIDQVDSPVAYAIKAGVAERDYAAYHDFFFTEYIGKGKRFLTWAANARTVHADQPEYLYLLTHFSPLPTSLKLISQVYYTDGTSERLVANQLTTVYPYKVYCFPVGPQALELTSRPKPVSPYEVWVSNQDDERLTEIRWYRLETQYRRTVRFLLFANSLGGFDTLYCTGKGVEQVRYVRQITERFTGYDYRPEFSEKEINEVTGERELTVSTGWLSKAQGDYLQELALSPEIYLVTDRAYLPVIPVTDSLKTADDDETLLGRNFVFRYTNPEQHYSRLPSPDHLPKRPTGWRPKAITCLLDANGKRTGMKAAVLLEKYYVDDNTRVPEAPIKSNVPGTEGYLPPVPSADCLASPFLSAAISRSGTFQRSNCGADQVGGPALITVPAGLFGSEVSQADADSKAEAEFTRLITQSYADQYGSCTTAPKLYAWDVPAGHWHYRSGSPQQMQVYFGSQPWGNSWTEQGQTGPYVFPQNANDLNFPVQGDLYWWFLMLTGKAGQTYRIEVFSNGTLVIDRSVVLNHEGGEHLWLFGTDGVSFYNPLSGSKVYVKMTEQ